MTIREATATDASLLAGLHAGAFAHAWPAAELAALLAQAGAIALVADQPPRGLWDPLESTCRHASLSIL